MRSRYVAERPHEAGTGETSLVDPAPLAEDLQVQERLIAAPVAGILTVSPDEATVEGDMVHAGQPVGSIERNTATTAVVSPHTGLLMGHLAHPGERVRAGQPLAWLRVAG